MALPLPLRNRLAELILEAFEPGEGRATLVALARVAGAGESTLDAADARRLLDLGWFDSPTPGRLRWKGAVHADAEAVRERASRGAAAVRGWRDPAPPGLVPLLGRAAALANQGLYFEVHELLEPDWFRAAEPERTALQGLIQVAVGFHHLENGNRDGGHSLLALGVAKLSQAGSALPLDLAGWLPRLREALARVAKGGSPPTPPRWPAPP